MYTAKRFRYAYGIGSLPVGNFLEYTCVRIKIPADSSILCQNIYVLNLKKKKKHPNQKMTTMSPYPHKIFKLALRGDTVCSACGFMLCLYLPQAPFHGCAIPIWQCGSGPKVWIQRTPPSPLAPNTRPGLLRHCPHPIHSINKTQQDHTYAHKRRSLNHWQRRKWGLKDLGGMGAVLTWGLRW